MARVALVSAAPARRCPDSTTARRGLEVSAASGQSPQRGQCDATGRCLAPTKNRRLCRASDVQARLMRCRVGDLAGGCRCALAILALGPVFLRLDGRASCWFVFCRASDVQARLMRCRSETWREVAGAFSPSLRLGLCSFALDGRASCWFVFCRASDSSGAAHAVQVGDLAGGCRCVLAILALGPVFLRLDGRASCWFVFCRASDVQARLMRCNGRLPVQVGDLAGGCRYALAILALGPVSLRLDGLASCRFVFCRASDVQARPMRCNGRLP